MKELVEIQTLLNAPKGQYNKFGQYYYRSCEDILAAVKPLLLKYECYLTLTDEVKEIGSPYHLHQQTRDTKKNEILEDLDFNGTRFYVEATATFTNKEGVSVSVKAYAREETLKKGMDGAQITGSASSYARKYALNGLFAIDDVKDADATNTHGQTTPTAKPAAAKKVTATTKPAAKPATQPAQYATEPPAVDEQQQKKFIEVSVANPTKAEFSKAFNDLRAHNPEFDSEYWRTQANKYYASLAE